MTRQSTRTMTGLRLFATLTLSLLLSACATQSVDNSYVPSEHSGRGIAIVSVTYSGRYSGYSVIYSSLDKSTTGRFQVGEAMALIPYIPKMDFETDAATGNVVAVELPAGSYEINDWHVGSGYFHLRPARPFSIRFDVAPGKAVYLGNFHFEQTGSMGLSVTGVKLAHRDETKRDIPAIARKLPNVARAPLSASVAEGKQVDNLGGGFDREIHGPAVLPLLRPAK